MGREYIYDSKEVFETIVKDNPNVRMIICGHCVSKHYIEVLSLKNAEGKDVFCLMVNYQHYREGGRGYIGILDCLEDGFLLKSYSTYESKDGGIYIPLVEH